MKKTTIFLALLGIVCFASCGETKKQDNTTQSADTMVIKQNRTDSATNTISTDTTKR